MRIFLFLFTLSFALTLHAEPTAVYPFSAKADATRFNQLLQETRCVVCQNQNIADSNAPLANDLRQKIYNMINEKKTDIEIKDFLVKRYGDFILLKPPVNKLTLLLWIFPFLALVCLVLIFRRLFNRA